MKKAIALCALLCIMAIGCFACGSPRGSGNGSIKARTAASVNVGSVQIDIAKPSFETARTVAAVGAVSTAEIGETATETMNSSTQPATFTEPGALASWRQNFEHDAYIAKVLKLPNRLGYNGFAASHTPRADV